MVTARIHGVPAMPESGAPATDAMPRRTESILRDTEAPRSYLSLRCRRDAVHRVRDRRPKA